MLTIRADQMRVLGEARGRQFRRRVLAHLRSELSTHTKDSSDAQLLAMIGKGIGDAEKHQVTTEADVVRYVEYMVLYGPGFDSDLKYAWAGAILRTPGITGTEKMDRIDDYDLFARP